MRNLLKRHGILKLIEESVYENKYTIEEVANYCKNLNLDLKRLYFQGYYWNVIDLFRGDVSELIPLFYEILEKKLEEDKSLNLADELNKLTKNQYLINKIYKYKYTREG